MGCGTLIANWNKYILLDSEWSKEYIGFTMMCVYNFFKFYLYAISDRRHAQIFNVKRGYL